MEDPETRARKYIQQAYADGGHNDVAVLAQLAQAEALLAIAAALTRLEGRPARATHSSTDQVASGSGTDRATSGAAYQVAEIRRKHPQAYARWTTEDDAALVDAHRAGHGVDSLAGTFGRQPGAIRSRLAHLGVQAR